MTEQLVNLDTHLFKLVNTGLQNPFFDWVMPFLRDKFFWIPFYLFLVVFLVRKFRIDFIWVAVFVFLTVLLSDQTSAGLIKPLVKRLRPCNDPVLKENVHLLVNCGQGYSFVSSHATNHFALAVFLIFLIKSKRKWVAPLLLFWAASVSFAQVYVGVHYPLDVIAGGALGILIGRLMAMAIQRPLKMNMFRPAQKNS